MTFNKTKLALGVATASLAVVSMMVSPQAAAHSKKAKKSKSSTYYSESYSSSTTSSRSNSALEAQVNQLSDTVKALQSELNRVKAAGVHPAESAKVQELDQWMASMKASPVDKKSKDNLVSVRGGWAQTDNKRGGKNGSAANSASLTSILGVNTPGDILAGGGQHGLGPESDAEAFYYGGAFDFNVNNDLFGLMDHTSFQIELGIEYNEFSDTTHSSLTGQQVTVNMLRLNASPKIKFMHGSKFRPWLIPVGLDINIISPPSGAVTVMNGGMNFGAGAEYELLKGIVLGGDVRYHYSTDNVDGVDTDGISAGGSVGFKF